MRRHSSMSEGLMATGVRAALGVTFGGAAVSGTKISGSTAGLTQRTRDRTRALGLLVTELGFCAATAVMAPMSWTASQSPTNLMVIGEADSACSSRRMESLVKGSGRLSTAAGADTGVARADGLLDDPDAGGFLARGGRFAGFRIVEDVPGAGFDFRSWSYRRMWLRII